MAPVVAASMKAGSAVEALSTMLAKDTSPIARDGAARALGLIAAPSSLKALIYAAQADDDREAPRLPGGDQDPGDRCARDSDRAG